MEIGYNIPSFIQERAAYLHWQMSKPDSPHNVWVLRPTAADLRKAAVYASIALPWTFNRLNTQTSVAGQIQRAQNITKGVVGQEVLRRELESKGMECEIDRTDHRNPDWSDFSIGADNIRFDVKTMNYYTDYEVDGRPEFGLDYLIANSSYNGPEWNKFFPMLVPHNQIDQDKHAYCFAIASSKQLDKIEDTGQSNHFITAFPYGDHLAFFSSKRLCEQRERENAGIMLEIETDGDLLSPITGPMNIEIIGEWEGSVKRETVVVAPGNPGITSEFSCVSSFRIDFAAYRELEGSVYISVKKNLLRGRVPPTHSKGKNLNVMPRDPLKLDRTSFCDLYLPDDYCLNFIGWIEKDSFLEACRTHHPWVWPNHREDDSLNRHWVGIDTRTKKMLIKAGLSDAVDHQSQRPKCGVLKTTGRGFGACCFVYPNVGTMGGVRETNFYVLPADLVRMEFISAL